MKASRRQVRARWIHTLDPDLGLIEDAVLTVGGTPLRILALGSGPSARKGEAVPLDDLGEVLLAPGLVNVHLHLADAHLKGRLRGGAGFAAWAESMMQFSGTSADADSLVRALAEMAASGTALAAAVYDRDCPELAARGEFSGVELFYAVQLFGFNHPGRESPHLASLLGMAPRERIMLSAHALYSTAPESIRMAHRACRENRRPFFIHLAESPEESLLLGSGTGRLTELFKALKILPEAFEPPGCSPVAYAAKLGLLGPGTVAVHCVHLDDEDLAAVTAADTHVCLCPRSNAFIGVGRARFEALLKAGGRICLGTDGLGSTPDLNLWNELLFLMDDSDLDLPPERWLALATRNGAEALGRGGDYGRLAPGCRAAWSVVPEALAQRLEG